MQDRVSNHPGRWLLTPVTGQTNVYDFTREDDPTVVGTPLNKASLLTDAVATAIGALSGSVPDTPNEALDELASVFSTMGISNNAKIETTSYVGAGSSSTTTYKSLTFSISPRIIMWYRPGEMFTPSKLDWAYGMIWVYGNTKGPSFSTGSYYDVTFDFVESTNTIRWKCNSSDSATVKRYKYDESGVTYRVIAIGVK